MEKAQRHWKRVPPAVRKPLVFMVGFAIIAAGIAMLVLPGPGWGAILLGLAVLATEFAFAERLRDRIFAKLKAAIRSIRRKR